MVDGMGASFDAARGDLFVDGQAFHLTICEGRIAARLVAGEVVREEDADLQALLNMYISRLRKKTPLQIRTLGQGRGYCLEGNDMADDDHTATRPAVDNAIKATRGAMRESSISGDMEHGKVEYDHKTGKGKTAHTTPDVEIEITISPKPKD